MALLHSAFGPDTDIDPVFLPGATRVFILNIWLVQLKELSYIVLEF